MNRDREILGELARKVAEIAAKDIQQERRDLWAAHNSFRPVRPPIYIRAVADRETIHPYLECEDPFFRARERSLRRMILQDTLGDDYVIEPWVTLPAALELPEGGGWGVPLAHASSDPATGAFTVDPPLKKLSDIERMVVPKHSVDEEETQRRCSRLAEVLDDRLGIEIDRSPFWTGWHADISTDLAQLRGIEQILWDMMDNPGWLHRLLAFMRDGVLKAQAEAEAAGHYRLVNHYNQSMPFAEELDYPRSGGKPVNRKDLWVFAASQETSVVSPEMFDEFILSYQEPIMAEYGLVSYGCCEDLSRKIPLLKRIPNLRRVAVTPFADVKVCAEQLGDRYIASWRPSPADMVAYGFDEERVTATVKDAKSAFQANGCRFDICLKDVETVQGDVSRIRRFVDIVRRETEDY
jgi:hypothetical protein